MASKRRTQILWRGVRDAASVLANVAATPRGETPGGYRGAAAGRH